MQPSSTPSKYELKELPEPESYWQDLFKQYFSASTEADKQILAKIEENLQALADACVVMPSKYNDKVNLKKVLSELASIPTQPRQLNESEWSLLFFGHALRSILELVGHYDARSVLEDEDEDEDEDGDTDADDSEDNDDADDLDDADTEDEQVSPGVLAKTNNKSIVNVSFTARQAFNNVLHLMLDDFTTRLSANPIRANLLRKDFLANANFYNENGWFLLKYVMRSYVEFILFHSGIVERFLRKKSNKKSNVKRFRAKVNSADKELKLAKSLESCLQPQASYPQINSPLLYEPQKWQQGRRGGKAFNPKHLVKLPAKSSLALDYLQLVDGLDMPEIFNGLNFLQQTPWRVNERLLKVIQAVYYPENPQEINKKLKKIYENSKAKDSKCFTEAQRIKDSNKPNSLIGSLLQNGNKFYYPYQLDYRGRIYPDGGWLTPQGDGMAKALLEFSQGKPLPPEKTKEKDKAWLFLAVHGSQFIGNQRIADDLKGIEGMPTLEDRRRWILRHHNDILTSAENPLENTWWLDVAKDGDAWQFLAFCFAWEEAINGKPSHLPVHVDGSCNGLQHMAALMRDRELAENTNLLHKSEQKDTYRWVLEGVKKRIKQEADDKSSTWQPLARWVIDAGDLLNRDVAKKVVMVFSYGSTDYGKKIEEYFYEKFTSFVDGKFNNKDTLNWPTLLEILNAIRSDEVLAGAYKVKGWMFRDGEPSNKYTKKEVEEWLQQQKNQDASKPYFCFVVNEDEQTKDNKRNLKRDRLVSLLFNSLAHYLAHHFNEVMDNQLISAVTLRKELLSWTGLVASATNLPVTWVSPMGLPVSQIKKMNFPYRDEKKTKKSGSLTTKEIVDSYFPGATIDWKGLSFLEDSLDGQNKLPTLDLDAGTGRRQIPEDIWPNVLKFKAVKKSKTGQVEEISIQNKQASPFVPNFIHSLDASHLMLTLNRCMQLDIDAFSAVHDSFGTHAVDMPKLARALRDTFILLHKVPLLEKYQQWFNHVCNPEKKFDSLHSPVEGAVIGLIHSKWWLEAKKMQAPINENALKLPTHDNETFDLDEVAKSEYIFF